METSDRLASAAFSRRTLLKGAGAAGFGLTLAQAGVLRAVAQGAESVSDIVNIAATAEELAVTLLGGAISSAQAGSYNKPIPDAVVAILQAARSEEQYHLDYLQEAGGKPLTSTFTIPDPKLLTDYDTLFATVVKLEAAFIAAYAAAAREFALLNQPALVKVAFQIGAVEAEHRVLANYALGTRPANDVAFEAVPFNTVGDAAAALKQLGFIGGSGAAVSYPGPGSIQNTGVSETQPGGATVACMPMTMPNTGAGTAFGAAQQHGLEGMFEILGLFGVGAATLVALAHRFAARPAHDEGGPVA